MTGLQIASLVSDTPRNTEVFHLKKGESEPVPLDKEIHIENCDEFRVIRNNVAGGFVEPTRIERELDKLRQGGCRVDSIQMPFLGAIYRNVPTRPGYRHLQMTDVLVIVPSGYLRPRPLDGAYLPAGSPLLRSRRRLATRPRCSGRAALAIGELSSTCWRRRPAVE